MPEPSNPAPPQQRPADQPATGAAQRQQAGDARDPGDAEDAPTTCAVCGKERPAGWRCGCGDGPGPMVPEGWDPALTRGTGPRLPLTGRPGGRSG